MPSLPPFNEEATCPQCGWSDIPTRYVSSDFNERLWADRQDAPDGKCLRRRCSRCAYFWFEACVDTATIGEPPPYPSDKLIAAALLSAKKGSAWLDMRNVKTVTFKRSDAVFNAFIAADAGYRAALLEENDDGS